MLDSYFTKSFCRCLCDFLWMFDTKKKRNLFANSFHFYTYVADIEIIITKKICSEKWTSDKTFFFLRVLLLNGQFSCSNAFIFWKLRRCWFGWGNLKINFFFSRLNKEGTPFYDRYVIAFHEKLKHEINMK